MESNPLGALRFGNFYRQACPWRVGTEGDQPIPTLGLITDLGALPRRGLDGKDRTSFPFPWLCCSKGIETLGAA